LQGFLNFTSPWPFLLLALSVLLGVPGAFAGAYIQAHQRFVQLSTANILGAGSKLLLSAGLVLAGLRAIGAVMGVVASQVLSLGYSTMVARRLGRPNSFRHYLVLRRPDVGLIRPELRYAGLVLLTSLAVNTILSLDILFAKHYFAPAEAGLYAGIATVARIMFFLTGPLTGVLVASVVPQGPAAANRALLRRSVALLVLLGGSALGLFVWQPGWVTSLLVGPRYAEVAHLLPTLSLAIFILSLANLLLLYQVALRRVWAAPAAIVGLGAMMAWLLMWHQQIADIVTGLLAGSTILLATTLATGWRGKRTL
jgi:O-antigen/teichoic acid export membrane protein